MPRAASAATPASPTLPISTIAPVLSIRNLRTVRPTTDGAVVEIDDVSFDIRSGQTVAVVGEASAGRSVNAKSILRLGDHMDGEVRTGSILYDHGSGKPLDIARMPLCELRAIRGNALAMMIREPPALLDPALRVGEQIAGAIALHQKYTQREALDLAVQALKLVRIPQAERCLLRYPHELSGVMRQRVVVAMALASRPRLLVADDPTTSLDAVCQAQILALIRRLQREVGMSVMFFTHDMGAVAEIADRVVVLWQGRKVEDAPVDEIFQTPQHPYTRMLIAAAPCLGSMKGIGAPEPYPAIDIDGCPACRVGEVFPPSTVPPPLAALTSDCPVLETVAVTVRFPVRRGPIQPIVGNVHAVESVSLKLFAEETLALVGEAGSGKSTLGRAIMRIVEPVSGGIIVHGQGIKEYIGEDGRRHSHRQLQAERRQAQMVFQDSHAALNPRMTISEIVSEPLLIHDRTASDERRTRALDLLERVGLSRIDLDRFPHEFAGEQCQRICIARAMALAPSIIITDEIVSSLDIPSRAGVVNLLMEMQRAFGIAYLFISSDLAAVERASHRVAVMHMGEIVEIGPREAVFTNPQHRHTHRLLESVSVADPRRRRERQPLDEEIPSPVRPPGFEPVIKPMYEVAKDHFVQAE